MCSLCLYIVCNCPGALSAPLVNVQASSTKPLSMRLSGLGHAAQMSVSTGSSEHPHTPEEADPPTYHPQVPEGHKQLPAPPEVQQVEEELEQLNINVIAAHHLPPIL